MIINKWNDSGTGEYLIPFGRVTVAKTLLYLKLTSNVYSGFKNIFIKLTTCTWIQKMF